MTRKSTRPPPGPPSDRRKVPRLDDDDVTGSRRTETHLLIPGSTAPPPQDTLTVLSGMDEDRIHTITTEVTRLGRDPSCEVRLQDRGVSRHHASILRMGQMLVLRDHDAKNGTFINGRRVREQELRPGDEIQLGAVVHLLYTCAASAEARQAQQRAARDRLLNEQMYLERLESIANMVAGVAHEINTPLGVATTANGVILSLIEEIGRTAGPLRDELIVDLKHSVRLMNRALERASRLVRSFRQLSASQLSDECIDCSLSSIIYDCLDSLSAETKKHNVTIRTSWAEGAEFKWRGFPGHLSQVLVNLIQNVLAYAYKDGAEGTVDLRLLETPDHYRLEVEDYGAGVPKDIYPRLFEPFVTSGRANGGTGLGLAITHNIVTNLLSGKISCTSTEGKGTKFVVTFPRELFAEDVAPL